MAVPRNQSPSSFVLVRLEGAPDRFTIFPWRFEQPEEAEGKLAELRRVDPAGNYCLQVVGL
ncbi:MAG TPA: hypothetical protein VJ623_10960 [Holophagaceae bacterium]|nr:hypothetical protein [Holophagaceae bacterium]